MKFYAAILNKINNPLIIDEIENEKLLEGQVLLKIIKTGICRSQIFEIFGGRGEDKWLPHLLGHEAIGLVIDIGKGVKKVKIGEKVIVTWISSKGINANPAKYIWRNKRLNGGQVTTFSEYSVCSENKLVPLNTGLKGDISPSIGCAWPTGYGLSLTLKKIKKSKTIGIMGLGGIGMAALLGVLDQNKNATIITYDLNELRLNQAKKLGADLSINPSKEEVLNKTDEYTSGKLLDLLIECSGSIVSLNKSLSLINDKGLVKFLSHPNNGDLLLVDPFELIKGKRIEGSWGGGVNPDIHFIEILESISQNKFFNKLYSEVTYPLSEINKAVDDLKSGEVLRPVIKF